MAYYDEAMRLMDRQMYANYTAYHNPEGLDKMRLYKTPDEIEKTINLENETDPDTWNVLRSRF